MATKKKNKDGWKQVASKDILYKVISYPELLGWIQSSVPEDTLPEDIKIEFEVKEYFYYDNAEIEAQMLLLVKEV